MRLKHHTNRWRRAADALTAAAVTCAMVLTSVAPAFAATARATTMKLEQTEGTVSLKTQNGTARRITEGMRLYNGNTLETKEKSYAYVSLDSTKAVKLDQGTLATLRQSGKELELLVKSGKLFFNVSQPLTEKESMNVRTSTMVTGIRGTCGIVEYVTANTSRLYLLEGKVTLGSGENATTIHGGQTATVVVQPKKETPGGDKPGDSEKPDKEAQPKVVVEAMTEQNVPVFAIEEIVSNPTLQKKIEATTELKVEKLEQVLEEAKKAEEAEKNPEKKPEKEEEKETEPEQTIPSGGGSVTVDPAPGNPGTSDPKPVDPEPVDPEPVDPEPVDPEPVDPEPVDPEPEDPTPEEPGELTETMLHGEVTLSTIEEAFGEFDKVHLGEDATLQIAQTDGELLIPAGKELVVWGTQSIPASTAIQVGDGGSQALLCVPQESELTTGEIHVSAGSRLEDHGTLNCTGLTGGAGSELINNYRLNVKGAMQLSNGAVYENHGEMDATDLMSDGGAVIKNTAIIRLSGAYTSEGTDTYEEGVDGMLVSGNVSTALPEDRQLMTVEIMENSAADGVIVKRVYAPVLHRTAVNYLNECACLGYVNAAFCRDAVAHSYVPLQSDSNRIQLQLGAYSLHIKDENMSIGANVQIHSRNSDQTILLSGNGTLRLIGSSTLDAQISNEGGGYAIARTDDAAGNVEWKDTGMRICSADHCFLKGSSINTDGTVTLPDYVTAQGMVTYKDDSLCLIEIPSSFEAASVSVEEVQTALNFHDTVTISSATKVTMSETDTLTIPAGRRLYIYSQMTQTASGGYSGGFNMYKGSKITVETGGKLYIGGIVMGNGSIEAKADAGENTVIEVFEGGQVIADLIAIGFNVQLINNGIIDIASIESCGGAGVENYALIKLAGAYEYTTEGVPDKYTASEAAALISNRASTAMPEDSLLVYAYTLGDETENVQYYYADALSTRVASYMNRIITDYREKQGKKLYWSMQKDARVIAGSDIEFIDFNADLGTFSIQVAGHLTLNHENSGMIRGCGTMLFDMQGGTLELTGTTGSLQSGVTSTGEITTTDSYVIKGSQSPYQIIWSNTGLSMSAPHGVNKTVDNLSLDSDGSTVVNPTHAYLTIPSDYHLMWESDTTTLRLISGS